MKKCRRHHVAEGFVLDKEKIRRTMNASPAAKLQWLEEANNFLIKVADRKTKKLWEKFRRGEI
ncbi:MAG: hypothetical protein NTX71_12460 [Candidatus Aureabacteria bacterium]|nr:hypothetical protein [Candidatus Auribacterota bacterium]